MQINVTIKGLDRLREALAGVCALMLADAAHEAMQRAYRAGVPSPRVDLARHATAWHAPQPRTAVEQYEAVVARVLAEQDLLAPWRAIVAQCVGGGDGDTNE